MPEPADGHELPKLTDRQSASLVALREPFSDRRTTLTALDVAHRADIRGVRRGGNGAVKGSWSGWTSPALSIASTMTSLVTRGLVYRIETTYRGYGKAEYGLTDEGRRVADELHAQASTDTPNPERTDP